MGELFHHASHDIPECVLAQEAQVLLLDYHTRGFTGLDIVLDEFLGKPVADGAFPDEFKDLHESLRGHIALSEAHALVVEALEQVGDEPVADLPIAVLGRTGEITLLQLDGEMTKEELKKAIELGKKVCKQIYEIQKKALKEKYIK